MIDTYFGDLLLMGAQHPMGHSLTPARHSMWIDEMIGILYEMRYAERSTGMILVFS
jgi:hypothetical protein